MYKVINNETGYTRTYSKLAWNVSWYIVFLFGFLTGLIFQIYE